jgi:hypothetical protein
MKAVSLGDAFGQGLEALFDSEGNLDLSTFQSGKYVNIAGKRIYFFTTAITANSTVTAAPVGSIGLTSNATGRASVFVSDGSKWQFITNA